MEYFYELCPNCNNENKLRNKGFGLYKCMYCGYEMASCSLCDPDSANCRTCKLNK